MESLVNPATSLNTTSPKLSVYVEEAKKLSVIAGPLILSSLVSMGVSIIDLSMMAWLGSTSLAAGAVASDYYSVFFYFFIGIIAALSTLISRARGANDSAALRKFTQGGFVLAVVSGLAGLLIMWNTDFGLELIGIDKTLIQTGLPYAQMMGFTFVVLVLVNFLHYFLSAHGNTNAIFFASLFALPVNALGNYALMFGHFGFPQLGLAGAGLSSLFATSCMFIFLLFAMARNHYFKQYALLKIKRIEFKTIREIISVGLPIGISNLGEMGVFLLATVLMGKFGAEAVAAHVVALRMAGVIYAIPLGFAQAATVRIGFAMGAKQLGQIATVIKTTLAISVIVGILYLALISLYRLEISTLFLDSNNTSQHIIFQSSLFLLILAIAQPLDCIGTVGNGILRGFKDTRRPMLFSIVAFWGVGFFGGITLAFFLGMQGTGLWLGLAGASSAFGVLIGYRLMQKWRQMNLHAVIV